MKAAYDEDLGVVFATDDIAMIVYQALCSLRDKGLGISVRPLYSGRRMYGRTCLGYAARESFFGRLGFALQRQGLGVDEAEAILFEMESSGRQDHLGRGYIWYWPFMETYRQAEK